MTQVLNFFLILIETAMDIDLTYDSLYLLEISGSVKTIDLINGSRMSTEDAVKLQNFNFENIFY